MQYYTTIEQSKKLVELGLNLETADMYYPSTLPKSGKFLHNPTIGNPCEALKWYNLGYTKSGKIGVTFEEFCIPCWSLGALWEIIFINCNGVDLISSPDKKCWISSDYPTYDTEYYDNALDACYEMVCWLLENKIIKKGETK